MAFHDYELIHTKRVVRERRGTNLYRRRRWEAQGGYASWYFAAALGGAGYSLLYKNATRNYNPLIFHIIMIFAYSCSIWIRN